MPIYAYRCEACGFAKDVLQKVSDPQLTTCLSCGQETFKKQVTAAGFQLKGTGWYVTDFKGGSGGTTAPAPSGEAGKSGAEAGKSADAPAADKSAESKPAAAEAKPAAKSDSSS